MQPIILQSAFKHLPKENLIIIDARAGKDNHQKYLNKHIKGARLIDMDKDLAEIGGDAAFGGRHPLPEIGKFAETLSRLGISEKDHIIVYNDKNGSNAAARAWWMLRSFGFEKVQVLDGGIQNAEKQGLEFSDGEESFEKTEVIKKENWLFPISNLEDVENELINHSQPSLMLEMPTVITANPNLSILWQGIFQEPSISLFPKILIKAETFFLLKNCGKSIWNS